jgi:hypothetical protein
VEFEIKAGAKLDLLTPRELKDALAPLVGWTAELARGVRFRRFAAQTVVAGGVWTVGGNTADNNQDTLGPSSGMLWAVTRIAVSGGGFVAGTDTCSVHINDISPATLVDSGITRSRTFDIPVLCLAGGDRLGITGVGTGVGVPPDITVSGQAVELPTQLAWLLV